MNKDFIKLNGNYYLSLQSISTIDFIEEKETTRDSGGSIISGNSLVLVIHIYLIGECLPIAINPFRCKDMGEYHRIKREIESFLGISEVTLTK